jgi:hypothetical protein
MIITSYSPAFVSKKFSNFEPKTLHELESCCKGLRGMAKDEDNGECREGNRRNVAGAGEVALRELKQTDERTFSN